MTLSFGYDGWPVRFDAPLLARLARCLVLAVGRLSVCQAGLGALRQAHLAMEYALPPPPCRVWGGSDLAPRQTLSNGPGWVTDCLLVDSPAWRKLVVAAQDRTVGALIGCHWVWWVVRRVHGKASGCR